MTGAPMSEGAALLIVLLAGFLPTEIWRSLAILAGRRVEEGSPVFHWVKAVATALLAAVVARLLFAPAGALAAVPLVLRLGAVAGGVAGFLVFRRSVFAGVLVGEVLLVAGILLSH
ncbi:AzlD domain-containing protein [Xanthobacter oligotrophicus]|uniref:AzlD domain-containing protein n=1 Tax=Xanthobacter oligotrophicus TaxID=2607286 RepID=A0ABW6ZUQ8_9HYPH